MSTIPASIWVMYVIVIVNGQFVTASKGFDDQAHCEAAKTEATADIIKAQGSFQGNITCFEAKIGTAA